jgi:hypothetical protein
MASNNSASINNIDNQLDWLSVDVKSAPKSSPTIKTPEFEDWDKVIDYYEEANKAPIKESTIVNKLPITKETIKPNPKKKAPIKQQSAKSKYIDEDACYDEYDDYY